MSNKINMLQAMDNKAVMDVIHERLRQIDKEGFKPEMDDLYVSGELIEAARTYLWFNCIVSAVKNPTIAEFIEGGGLAHGWPWAAWDFKPTNRRRDLIKAAALIIAEIERIDRSKEATNA